MDTVRVLAGGLATDDRGEVGFVNDFDFAGVKRFYTIRNFRQGFIRAWHGHKKEAKYFTVTNGAALIAAVKVDDWETPSVDVPIERHVLTAKKPSVLYIPSGYANGFMSLTQDAALMVFSTTTLEESLNDDYRFDAYHWNPWEIIQR